MANGLVGQARKGTTGRLEIRGLGKGYMDGLTGVDIVSEGSTV